MSDPSNKVLAAPADAASPGAHSQPEQLLLDLALALAESHTASHRLESALADAAESLGVQAQFFSIPTGVFASIGSGVDQRASLMRVEPADVNLARLIALNEVLDDVARGDVSDDFALERVAEIREQSGPWGRPAVIASFGLASACSVVFFGGAWREIGVALLIGTLIGLIVVFASVQHRLRRVGDFVAGLTAAAVAAVSSAYLGPLDVPSVTLASVIVLIPGLTLTVAMSELAEKNLVSGSSRLVGALMVLLTLALGVAAGQLLTGSFNAGGADPVRHFGILGEAAAVLLAPVAFVVLFQARSKDYLPIALVGAIGYASARAGAAWAGGGEFGAGIGAFCVGASANLYSRLTARPAAVASLPGILLLVPGSIGFRGVSSLLHADTVVGLDSAFRTAVIGAALVVGLLLANAAVPARRLL